MNSQDSIMQEPIRGGVEEYPFQRVYHQTRGLAWLWIVIAAFLFGIMTVWTEQSSLLHYFVPLAYFALLYSSMKAFHTWRDPFNPLCLVLAVGFVRFFLPGILIWSGAQDNQQGGGLFQLMKLSEHDWQWGHALALLGMLAVVFGWLVVHAQFSTQRPLKFRLPEGVRYSSLAGMALGFVGVSAFFLLNASLGAILSGSFRSATIQQGSGKYFLLAYMLIVGSVLLCCYLLSKGFTWLALLPVGFSMMSYWPLGGRGRAIISVAAGLILLWYRGRERRQWKDLPIKPGHLAMVPVLLLCMITILYVGAHYRGNAAARAVPEALSLDGLWGYSKSAIYTDIGQLHSLAGAVAIGPGVSMDILSSVP